MMLLRSLYELALVLARPGGVDTSRAGDGQMQAAELAGVSRILGDFVSY